NPLLPGGGTVTQAEFDCDVGPFRVRFFRALPCDRPEVRRVVRDERERVGGRTFPAATGQNEHGSASERDSCLQAHSTLLLMLIPCRPFLVFRFRFLVFSYWFLVCRSGCRNRQPKPQTGN